MTTYKSIVGQKIQKVSSNPPTAKGGQVWYNTTTGSLKGIPFLSAWSAGGNLIAEKNGNASFGIQTAAIATGGSPYTNTVQKYNGTGFSNVTNYPINVAFAGAAGTETAGLVFGGISTPPGNTNSINTTNEYDGSSWTGGGNMNNQRSQFSGLGTQTAAVAALGFLNTTTTTANSEEYNGSSWTAGNSANNARRNTGAAGIETAGLVFGGGPPAAPNNHSEEYDGTSWSEGNNLNTARLMGVQTGAGIQTDALAFGGSADPPVTNATENYDGTSWTTNSATLATARYAPGCGTSTAAVAAGGRTNTANVSVTEEYNKSTNVVTGAAWASSGTMNTTRRYFAGLGTRPAALAAGGSTSSPGLNETNNSEEYNGVSWTEGDNLNTARVGLGGAGVQTSSIAAGGRTPGSVASTASEEYNGTSWTATPSLSTGRRYVAGFGASETAAVVTGGVVGGAPGAGTTQTATEHYNGSSWTSGGALNTAKKITSGNTCGTQTAGIYITDTSVEEYNGSAWSEQNDPNRGPSSGGGGVCGSQTASLFAGSDSIETICELYDGTSFVTTASLATGRGYSGGAGTTSATGTIFGGFIGPSSPKTTGVTEEFTGETTAVNIKTLSTS